MNAFKWSGCTCSNQCTCFIEKMMEHIIYQLQIIYSKKEPFVPLGVLTQEEPGPIVKIKPRSVVDHHDD